VGGGGGVGEDLSCQYRSTKGAWVQGGHPFKKGERKNITNFPRRGKHHRDPASATSERGERVRQFYSKKKKEGPLLDLQPFEKERKRLLRSLKARLTTAEREKAQRKRNDDIAACQPFPGEERKKERGRISFSDLRREENADSFFLLGGADEEVTSETSVASERRGSHRTIPVLS